MNARLLVLVSVFVSAFLTASYFLSGTHASLVATFFPVSDGNLTMHTSKPLSSPIATTLPATAATATASTTATATATATATLTPQVTPSPSFTGPLLEEEYRIPLVATKIEDDFTRMGWTAEAGFNISSLFLLDTNTPTNAEIIVFTILNGKLYFNGATWASARFPLTVWALLELLDRYPGRIPNVTSCIALGDAADNTLRGCPMHFSSSFFRYLPTGNRDMGYLWPDWSFWGYAPPYSDYVGWELMRADFRASRAAHPWASRDSRIFWRGGFTKDGGNPRDKIAGCSNTPPFDRFIDAKPSDFSMRYSNGSRSKYAFTIYGPMGWTVGRKMHMSLGSLIFEPLPRIYTFWDRFYNTSELAIGFKAEPQMCGVNDTQMCQLIADGHTWAEQNPQEAESRAARTTAWMEEHITMPNVYRFMQLSLQKLAERSRGPIKVWPHMRHITKDTYLQIIPCVNEDWHQKTYPRNYSQPFHTEGACDLAYNYANKNVWGELPFPAATG